MLRALRAWEAFQTAILSNESAGQEADGQMGGATLAASEDYYYQE